MKTKICFIVVLYEPSEKNIYNLINLSKIIDYLVIVDNSLDSDNSKKIIENCFCEIAYQRNERNFGIAHALNKGVVIASKEGYEWVVTSDQDSVYSNETIKGYKLFLESRTIDRVKVGIITPKVNLSNRDNIEMTLGEIGVREKSAVITSGNLINVKAYKEVGGYDENLFIDSVDFDYCLKLRDDNYKIFEFLNTYITHELGTVKKKKILNIEFSGYQHNSFRKYYMYRNHIILIKKYNKKFPLFLIKKTIFILWDFIKIIVFEDQKFKKIKSVFIGVYDGIKILLK